jgi:hypothetical protein
MATKIVNNLPGFHPIPFDDVEMGHFFLDEDGDLCIRTDVTEAFYLDGNIFIDMNAGEKVIPVNVTINIDSYGK